MKAKQHGIGAMLLALELAANDAPIDEISNAVDAPPELVAGWLENEDLRRAADAIRETASGDKPIHVFVVAPETGHDERGAITNRIKQLEMGGQRCRVVRLAS